MPDWPSSGGPTTAYHDAVLADSPVSYWRLSDVTGSTFADVQGLNPLTITAGSTFTRLQKGVVGLVPSSSDLAAYFGGGATSANSSPSSMPNVAPFTFECWINAHASVSGGMAFFTTSNGGGGWWLAVNDNNVVSRLNFTTASKANYITTNYPVVTNIPMHVVVVFDTSFSANFYLNGQFLEAVTGASNPGAQSGSLQIGTAQAGNDFVGIIDEVAVYNSGLSATRIAAHYSAAIA